MKEVDAEYDELRKSSPDEYTDRSRASSVLSISDHISVDKENSLSLSLSSSSFSSSSRSSLSSRRPLRSISRNHKEKQPDKYSVGSDKELSFESRPFSTATPSVLQDTAFDDLDESEFGISGILSFIS